MCEIVIICKDVNRIAKPRLNICKPMEICILRNFIFIKSSLATSTKPYSTAMEWKESITQKRLKKIWLVGKCEKRKRQVLQEQTTQNKRYLLQHLKYSPHWAFQVHWLYGLCNLNKKMLEIICKWPKINFTWKQTTITWKLFFLPSSSDMSKTSFIVSGTFILCFSVTVCKQKSIKKCNCGSGLILLCVK